MGKNKPTQIQVTIRVLRCAPDSDLGAWREDFTLPLREGMTVLDALEEINSTRSASIAFRRSCRAGRCGSCAMRINGRPRLACRTQLSALRGRPITVEPLKGFPVMRDLVVGMDDFWQKYERVRPWMQSDSVFMQAEVPQPQADLKKLWPYVNCALCGACWSECPAARRRSSFLGPAALVQSYRFNADSRDTDTDERLMDINRHAGVWGCDSARRCTWACPLDISPAHAIAAVRTRLLLRPLKAVGVAP